MIARLFKTKGTKLGLGIRPDVITKDTILQNGDILTGHKADSWSFITGNHKHGREMMNSRGMQLVSFNPNQGGQNAIGFRLGGMSHIIRNGEMLTTQGHHLGWGMLIAVHSGKPNEKRR
jgi:hypothetical protein